MLQRGSIGSLRRAIVAGTLAGLTALAPAALAQQPQPDGRVLLGDLFGEDSVNLMPDKARELADAARKAQAPGKCPLGTFFIATPEGDPLYQQALAAARRGALLQALHLQGIDASRFFVDSLVGGTKNDAWLDYDLDRERPKLDTVSAPPKGTRVKAGDLIKVTMVARDDADPKLWQRGIKTIQLVAESEGGRFVASENYEPCAGPGERRVEATYTIPSNPPPIVRLAALAEDHAGLMDADVGEFPTGIVWAGTIKLERDGRRGECSAIESETEFTIAVADDGAVSGAGTLNHSSYTCPGGYTAPAIRAAVTIGGKKQGGTFTLFLSDWPKTALLPRLPVGQWTVEVGEGSTGEGTLASGGMTDVIFRVKLECRACGRP
jgi:hypothetical protein